MISNELSTVVPDTSDTKGKIWTKECLNLNQFLNPAPTRWRHIQNWWRNKDIKLDLFPNCALHTYYDVFTVYNRTSFCRRLSHFGFTRCSSGGCYQPLYKVNYIHSPSIVLTETQGFILGDYSKVTFKDLADKLSVDSTMHENDPEVRL